MSKRVAFLAAAVSVAVCGSASAQEPPAISPELITGADALRAAQAALAACSARGLPATAVVTDADGWERVRLSDDKAVSIGLGSASRKVATVLEFRQSTGDLQARAASDKVFADTHGKDQRYYFSPGGFPLYRGDRFVGVLAVGGARTTDAECAQAGIRALAWATTRPQAAQRPGEGS